MEPRTQLRDASHIQGQMLRLSEHHAVAIYLRDGVTWIADFADGQGALIDANTWFRFHCGALGNSHAQRRMALESAIPIPPELGERIEALHNAAAAPEGREMAGPFRAFLRSLRSGRLGTLLAKRFRASGNAVGA